VNTHQAKTTLSTLLADVEEKGENVVICRNGKPVAKLVPVSREKADHFKQDPRLKVKFHGHPMDPVPNEAWPEEYR
jgi:prevent-host-death family protein